MNPFDEFPDPDKLFARVANYEWVRFAFRDKALVWRKKWEPIILEVIKKAEFLDWFWYLSEDNKATMEEALEEWKEIYTND